MLLITNLDKTNSRFMRMEGIVKDEEIKCEYVEDLGYKCAGHSFLIADPVIDGLVYFRHPDATWTAAAEESAEKLAAIWEDICDEDSIRRLTPGELMIGTHFKVLCWKDYGPCKAGQTYNAEIADFHGFGCDGFLVEMQNVGITDPDFLNINMFTDAINHFVLA